MRLMSLVEMNPQHLDFGQYMYVETSDLHESPNTTIPSIK